MKTMQLMTLALTLATASGAALARNRLHDADLFREMLEEQHLKGHEDAARAGAARLVESLPENDPLREQVAASGLTAQRSGAPDPAELAYATGTKTEYYCRGKGLVLAEGRHADGAWSKLLLVSADRRMDKDSYALVGDGSHWIYELSDSFRAPIRSELWQTWGRPEGFNIFEVRRLPNGEVDQGNWDYSWTETSFNGRHSINGGDVEPVRNLFMALQYQLWGSRKLGYDLRFEVGAKDVSPFAAQGNKSGRFVLKAEREVKEHLPDVSYRDAEGSEHRYEDCYRVEIAISYDETMQEKG